MENKSIEITIRLTKEEHRKIKWIADRFNLSISQTFISLIPSICLPESKIVENDEIPSASPDDLVPVIKGFDRNKLCELVDSIQKTKAGLTLAREIKKQLVDVSNSGSELLNLDVNTYRRLSRWIHPRRYTQRERNIQPIAEEISTLLFGKIIERINT